MVLSYELYSWFCHTNGCRPPLPRVGWPTKISFARLQFPPDIVRHAVWLYLRFILSFRDVEDLLAERGLDVSYETVRQWVLKFGPLFAKQLRRCRRHRPTSRWHLDKMAVLIAGRRFWPGEWSTTKARFSIYWCSGDAT
jgi:hypothetical protein